MHTPEIVAISANKHGLRPYSQWALHFYEQIAYHTYNSLALSCDDGEKLINDLGDKFTILLRNHGSITCGKTIQEAMFYTYHLQMAAKTQCLMSMMDESDLILPDRRVCSDAVKDLLNFEADLGARDWEAWKRLVKSGYCSMDRA
jgi:ribulose-5-phosphate 4-epimerase/fuculose-1-phosphate aldolase